MAVYAFLAAGGSLAKCSVAPELNDNTAIPISVARDRLSELAEDVLMRRADRIALSHTPYNERFVLMRASNLAKMEADLAALRKRLGAEPLSLRGTLRINGDPDSRAGHRGRCRPRSHVVMLIRDYTLNLNNITSPSCTTYSFPSDRTLPLSRASFQPPSATNA